MEHCNRREAARVPCVVPIRVEPGDRPIFAAHLVDVSRTGLRLRIPGAVLGVHRLSSLAQVARSAAALLGESFIAELHYEQLGPLVRKRLKTIRIAKRDWEHADVELGCIMCDSHLTDLEASMLGVHLPPIGVDEPEPHAAVAGPREEEMAAYIYGSDEAEGAAIVAQADALTRGMAMLTVADESEHLRDLDVTELAEELDDTYGSKLTLRISIGDEDLWVGPAEIKEIDVADEETGAVRLGVAFGRELRAEELRRLGLPSPA